MALAEADPTGETIKSMMRWVCEGLMPDQVHRNLPSRLVGNVGVVGFGSVLLLFFFYLLVMRDTYLCCGMTR